MPSQTIRTATSGDLPRIIELYATLAQDPDLEDTTMPPRDEYAAAFRDALADHRQRTFVLELDARIVASAVLVIVPNVSHRGRPYAIAENVVVDPAFRGRGIGESLMRHLVDEARAAGCYKLALTSNNARAGAHRFYERIGFTQTHKGFRVVFE